MTEKEFIPYEEALALKELGFDEPCFSIYYSKDKSFSWHHHKDHTNDEPVLDTGEFNISAPLYQQAFRWFRENEGMFIASFKISYEDGPYLWSFEITDEKSRLSDEEYMIDDYKTYEKAELVCLKKLIEIVKMN